MVVKNSDNFIFFEIISIQFQTLLTEPGSTNEFIVLTVIFLTIPKINIRHLPFLTVFSTLRKIKCCKNKFGAFVKVYNVQNDRHILMNFLLFIQRHILGTFLENSTSNVRSIAHARN